MCISIPSLISAQWDHTRLYYHDPATAFKHTDAVVTEEFRYTPGTPYQGVVIFQPLVSPGGSGAPVNKLQVSLTDNTPGASVVFSTTYELPPTEDMIPIAAAYKSVPTPQNPWAGYYIVVGESRSFIGNTSHSTWYMLLDQELKLVVPMTIQNFEFLSVANPLTKYTFPTDVCPVYHDNGVDFAITGVVLDNSPDPDVTITTTANRTMFIAKLNASSSSVVNWKEYTFNNGFTDFTRYTYPSRIIEIGSQSNPFPGYMVAGTTRNNVTAIGDQAFYFRTDQSLNGSSATFKTINDNPAQIPTVSNFAIGDIYYDQNTQEVYVAGTISYEVNSGERFYFFDKLHNITTSLNVNSFADNWPGFGSSAVGAYRLPFNPLNGFPKVGRIGEPNSIMNDACVITGVLYENQPSGAWTPTAKLPLLMYVHYSNFALSNWTSAQFPQLDLYPRINPGGGNPIPFYTAHRYDKSFYPNHTSFEFKPLFPKFYCVAGLSDNPPIPPVYNDDLLTLSVNYPVNVNICNYAQSNAIPEMIPVNSLGGYGINQNQFPLAQGPVTITTPNLLTLTDLDCGTYAFKPQKEDIQEAIKTIVSETEIRINGNLVQGDKVTIYSVQGGILASQKIESNTSVLTISISQLATGVYIFKLQHSGKNEILKFTKN